jgi:hypothetical protein
VKLVTETVQLQSRACLEHYLYRTGKDMECLDCLMLDLFMADEIHCLLSTAEKNVHDLLCFA